MTLPQPQPSEWITKSGLVGKRNWTERAIQRFLGEPEKTAPNPHYRSGAPISLYALSRVEKVEASPEFRDWLAKSAGRKRGSRAAVETKKSKLREYVEGLKINVPVFDDLVNRAVRAYNEHNYHINANRVREREWYFEPATVHGAWQDQAFRERICVNFLRHEMTTYERNLQALFGKVGVDEGRKLLRGKVYAAIAKAYPELAGECRQQQKKREAQGF